MSFGGIDITRFCVSKNCTLLDYRYWPRRWRPIPIHKMRRRNERYVIVIIVITIILPTRFVLCWIILHLYRHGWYWTVCFFARCRQFGRIVIVFRSETEDAPHPLRYDTMTGTTIQMDGWTSPTLIPLIEYYDSSNFDEWYVSNRIVHLETSNLLLSSTNGISHNHRSFLSPKWSFTGNRCFDCSRVLSG